MGWRSEWTGYGVAILGVALVVGVRVVFREQLGDAVPLIPFAIPVLWAGWQGGGRPAVFAALLSTAVALALFMPTRTPQLVEANDVTRVVLFLIFGGAAAALCEALHRARRQSQGHAEAVHENEERLRLAMDAARLGSWEWKLLTNEMYWSAETYALLGVPTSEPAALERFEALLGEDERARNRLAIDTALATGEYESEFWLARAGDPPGRVRHFYARGRVVKDALGRNARMLGVLADITQRTLAEHALRASEARVSGVLDSISDAVAAFDAELRFTHLNAAARRLFSAEGLDSDALIGRRMFLEAFTELRGGEVERAMERALRERAPAELEFPYEPWRHWYAARFYPAEDGGIVVYFRDVSERRELQAQVERQTRMFDAALSSIQDYVYIFNPAGRIAYANKALLDLWGISAEQAQRTHLRELGYSPDVEEKLLHDVRYVIETGQPATSLTSYASPTGAVGQYENLLSPVLDAEGRVVMVAGVSRDVTTRIRVAEALAASEERFRELANSIAQFAWTCDELGYATWYNQRWYDYTGTTFEEMRGDGWSCVHHPDHVERVGKGLFHCVQTGEPWEDSFPLRAKDGTYRWFLSRAVPIRDKSGKVVRWFGTNTDITERRELEEALREADRRKDEFLAMLAHELRNPLAPIRNAVEIQKLRAPLDPELVWSRDVIDRQVQQMGRLLDDLLDVSRISRNKLELRRERVQLGDVIASALETSRPLIKEGEHELELALPEAPIWLDADATRLSQVFSNLLNNAAKFMPRGGSIRVSAEVAGDDVTVRVRDRGVGIAPEVLPRIFETFTQASPPLDLSREGLGIGLSLARGLVELHRGSIEAQSEGPEQGSEFSVRLPLAADARPAAQQTRSSQAPARAATPRRVLVVDDLDDNATSLALLLRGVGHEVHVAHDGERAVELARELRPDAVVLDIGLPKLDGYEACRRIRKEAWGERIRLVAVTGWGQEEDRRRSFAAGFDHHLVKPVDPAELASLLAQS